MGEKTTSDRPETTPYKELDIRFPPSYRHHKKNKNPIALLNLKSYDPDELGQTYGNVDDAPHEDGKRRMPWWTDRVFLMIKVSKQGKFNNGELDRSDGNSFYD